MGIVTIKHSAPVGDLLSLFAGLKQLYTETNSQIVIIQRLNMVGKSYEGAMHKFEKNGLPVCMNEYMFEMVKPLILSQSWCAGFDIYKGQSFDIDIDKMRNEIYTPQPYYSINRWVNFVYPQMTCDLSIPYLDIPNGVPENLFRNNNLDKIIINITDRHRNYLLNYFFLKHHQEKLIFAGLHEEYTAFCEEWNLDIEYLKVNNFLELAQAIKVCNFFIGNQSSCFQIAEALKVPRMLEVFGMMPNVIPMGANGYEYLHQQALEYLFNKLVNL